MAKELFSVKAITSLLPGDHASCIYETDDELLTLLLNYIRDGIEQGHKVICLLPAVDSQKIKAGLDNSGLDTGALLSSGRLEFSDASLAFTKPGNGTREEMAGKLKKVVSDALAAGYASVRFANSGSIFVEQSGADFLLEYERQADRFIQETKSCIGICLYDRRCLDAGLLLDVMQLHPIVLMGGAAFSLDSVTEKKTQRFRRRLAELEQSSRILETISDGFVAIDRDYHYIYMNKQAEIILGLKRQELIGKVVWDLFPESIDSEFGDNLRDTMENSVAIEFEEFSARFNIWFEHHFYPHEDGLLMYFRDITERKAAEAEKEKSLKQLKMVNEHLVMTQLALAESEERYESLGELVPLGIWVCNASGRNTFVNDAYLDMFHITREEAMSGGWVTALAPGETAKAQEAWTRCLAEGTMWEYEHQICKDDDRRTILCRGAPIRDDSGNITCWVGIDLDITERKKAEEFQCYLVEVGTALSTSLDVDTVCHTLAKLTVPELADWCVVNLWLDDGSVKLAAIEHLDTIDEKLIMQLSPLWSLSEENIEGIPDVMCSGEPILYHNIPALLSIAPPEVGWMVKTARKLQLKSAMVVPLVSRSRVLGTMVFATAESGRSYDERDFDVAKDLACRAGLAIDNARLYEQSRDAVRARDEFLSVAAHELRTPITSLRGFAQTTIRQYQKNGAFDPARVERAFEVIDVQSQKLTKLANQLLDVSRIGAGRLELEKRPADLAALVRVVAANTQDRTQQHKLTVDAPESLNVTVDAIRIEQVITNLVDNAVKYSPKGGDIELRVAKNESGEVEISVRDHGVGIPLERRKELFSRFYQAHKHGQYGGMGLGLYISRQIVELHGGCIAVEFPEQGSRFIVTLPQTNSAESTSALWREN